MVDIEEADAIIAKWVERLSLGDWRVAVSPDPPPPDDRSRIDINHTAKMAAIRVRPDMPASQVEGAIVHELLHLVTTQMEWVVKPILQSYAPRAALELIEAQWDLAEHRLIVSVLRGLGFERTEWRPDDEPFASAFPST